MAGDKTFSYLSIVYMFIGIALLIGIEVFIAPGVWYLILLFVASMVFFNGFLAITAYLGEKMMDKKNKK